MSTDHICQDEKQPLPQDIQDPTAEFDDDVADAAGKAESRPDHDATEKEQVELLKEELASAKKEAETHYDRMLRLSADFENYKKRITREMSDLRNYANESIIKEFLPVLDNLERALQSVGNGGGNGNQVREGVEMTLKEILKIMQKNGVSPVEALAEPFNPAFHQAVMREETDQFPENTVTRMLQKGYKLHERLIRPAMVVVSAAITAAPEKSETGDDEKQV
ncbi:MAG: nucleotide exchange factor GrpE [Thermodesulfobacteriota bacterium]